MINFKKLLNDNTSITDLKQNEAYDNNDNYDGNEGSKLIAPAKKRFPIKKLQLGPTIYYVGIVFYSLYVLSVKEGESYGSIKVSEDKYLQSSQISIPLEFTSEMIKSYPKTQWKTELTREHDILAGEWFLKYVIPDAHVQLEKCKLS